MVFAVSAVFDGATWSIALRSFKATLLFGEIHRSKDPPSFVVLFEDGAALIGLGIAVLGTWASVQSATTSPDR